MRRSLPILLTVLALLVSSFLYAQTTQTDTPPDDMPFIFVLALAFMSIMAGGFIIGFITICILLAGMLALIMVGILSSSVLVGIYKKSFLAAFRTFLLLACGIFGALSGLCGFYLINSIFELNISGPIVAAIGSIGGALGGIILALSVVGVLRLFFAFTTKKLSLKIS